jgi:hypothetical protein
MSWVAILAKPNRHAFVALHRLGLIGTHEAVPPGEIKTKIAIMFLDHDGMVDAVHLRRDHEESQNLIESLRQLDIAMVEHAGRIEEHFKEDYGYSRGPQNYYGCHLNAHGQEYLERVETNPGGDIEIEVCMVHSMEAPEKRQRVKHGVLEIDNEVEAQNPEENSRPRR